MANSKMIPLLKESNNKEILNCISSQEEVNCLIEFEKEIASYVGVNGALAVNSGTAAIHLALMLLEVRAGDIIYCSTLTSIASANPITYQGAQPVFIDSEPETWNMSPRALEKALKDAAKNSKLPKAIIVVNLYGQCAKMDEILKLCHFYQVPIIEDSSHALGSMYKGKPSGTFGDFGVYSLGPRKIISNSSGGVLLSNDSKYIEYAKHLATQARESPPFYHHTRTGYSYIMSNILAGIGQQQLLVLDKNVILKQKVFNQYQEQLANVDGIDFVYEQEDTLSNRWLTVILIDEKLIGQNVYQIVLQLEKYGVETSFIHKPLHLQPVFEGCKYYTHDDRESVSTNLFQRGICLPSSVDLTIEDQIKVIDSLK
ncbi:DegT/DnrJ/EryC1/StrS family aminotransferase [Aquibacillus rhizosphaerae]|uniref:DegT/DnrJ/EryC1/StrS family aminotransferase n=1 Tax=Aquibacillus rhizosphaerae TaxID=3051431 RepID=A0ABT7L8X1_9BACI|nr:DegT/DnrJ/EryC1/StrS family aminotransferase [Aquibacillus sp. LR5S19]MDL4841030.1 DegT/DnrJ/EryC1/StrS family aminotransferase [Aquibacillus sp. LR5S19]